MNFSKGDRITFKMNGKKRYGIIFYVKRNENGFEYLYIEQTDENYNKNGKTLREFGVNTYSDVGFDYINCDNEPKKDRIYLLKQLLKIL